MSERWGAFRLGARLMTAVENLTVLLVDDDDILRAFVRRILIANGYQVIEAANGAEALEVAVAHDGPVHLLLTDIIMPKINGLVLAERILEERPNVSVLFMSGYVEGSLLMAKHPQSILLQKPFTPDSLIKGVRQVLASGERR